MQKKILFTLSLLSLIVASASAQVTPDFKQAGDEAVQVLQDLIRRTRQEMRRSSRNT